MTPKFRVNLNMFESCKDWTGLRETFQKMPPPPVENILMKEIFKFRVFKLVIKLLSFIYQDVPEFDPKVSRHLALPKSEKKYIKCKVRIMFGFKNIQAHGISR